jgi:DNA-binding PadR family transcriptional regulator
MNGMMRGHLKIMILSALVDKSMSGSEIIKKLEKDIGWKPSCGSVYPVLNVLEEEALTNVIGDISSTKKIYSLTKKGREELKKHNEDKEELMNEIVKVHKMIESTYGTDLQMDNRMIENFKSGKLLFGPLYKESEAMKKEFMGLVSEGLIDTKTKEIKAIVKDTTNKLRELRNKAKLELSQVRHVSRGRE